MGLWQASSYGAGKRHWYVTRGGGREVATDSLGRYRKFATAAAARKLAHALNSIPGAYASWDGPLTAEEVSKIDAAWETYKAAMSS